MSPEQQALLNVDGIAKQFQLGRRSYWDRLTRKRSKFVRAVRNVTFGVRGGETLVVLGESGCGKTTLGRLVVGLERPDAGTVLLAGERVGPVRERGSSRGRLQMVFQDPASSIDPFMKVRDAVAEPLTGSGLSQEEKAAKVVEVIGNVGLDNSALDRRASELSGGQRQRVSVARAIISEPEVIVLDEPTSSIDVSIQAQVLNLLVELQRKNGYAYLLITHDPNVARFMGDSVAVMYLGRIVEFGPAEQVLSVPRHPYTQALLSSAPKLREGSISSAVKGEPPSLIDIPPGCPYAPRCPYVMDVCRKTEPPVYKIGSVSAECYLYDADIMDKQKSL